MYSTHPKRFRPNVLAFIAIITIGAVGTYLQLGSSAASTNPYGYADSCVLSGNTTVIYGWAADPQVTTASVYPYVVVNAGSASVTLPTSSTTYRTSQITSWINAYRSGDPTPGEYGFVASFNGLYKGNSYAVSGTIENYGAGSNVALGFNQNPSIDGTTHNVFTGGKLPDACLATAPAPTPTPTPSPTPPPTPTPKPKPKSGSSSTPATPPSAAADASVTAGTTVAAIKVPADGATALHLVYNQAGAPAVTTDDHTASGDTTITLTGLWPQTAYSFQVVRTNGGGTVTLPAATFTTAGYNLTLTFTNKAGKPVSGITGTINDTAGTSATSGTAGHVTFTGLPGGVYTVSYKYKGRPYSSAFDTSNAADPGTNPEIITLHGTVNVDSLLATPGKVGEGAANTGAGLSVWWWLLPAVLLGAGSWFGWRWWRRRNTTAPLATLGTDVIDEHSLHEFAKHQPAPEPLPEHAGKSLATLVIESMRAAPANHTSVPIVPGGGMHEVDAPAQAAPPAATPPSPPATKPPADKDSHNTLHIQH